MPVGPEGSILEGKNPPGQESPWIVTPPLHNLVSRGTRGSPPAPAPVRPPRRGYGLAVLVAVVGAAAASLWAVTGFLDQIQRPEQFARTQVPGIASVVITQTGSHVDPLGGCRARRSRLRQT